MRIRSVDLRQLRYCVAAVDQGSLRKAAIWLEVRESTVSRRLRDLEGLLGTVLFIRHQDGVRPTEAGRRFSRQARDILRALEVAVEEVGTNGAKPGGDERADLSWAGMPVGSACSVCWGADLHSVPPGDRCGIVARAGSAGTQGSLRSDRAAALGETMLRLVEMLGPEPGSSRSNAPPIRLVSGARALNPPE